MNRSMQVQCEELSPSPVEGVADAAEKVARALAVAQEKGWASEEEARRRWWKVVGEAEVVTRAAVDYASG
ncbi:MAG TPA: hypothetical protein VGW38_14095 [Chloroflexota bacterium]|nr:hypothetical protein [Chloroflexota bacterium]